MTFPAQLITRLVPLPAGVSHAPLSGSLLSVQSDWLQINGVRVSEVSASPSLLGLFQGTPLAVAVKAPVAASAHVGGNDTRLQLSALEAQSRFEKLRPLTGLPGLGIDAALALSLEQGVIENGRCAELDGALTLSDFQGAELPAMSDITGRLSCDKGSVLISIEPDNSLRLNGTVRLTLQGRAVVDLSAEPPPGPLFELFVDFLGQPRDGKRFQIRFRS
nr:type II secretion system protein N [Litorivivens lipolytica]